MTDVLKLKLNDKIVEISYDDNGRYSLNDLYKASHATESKKPSKFLRYQDVTTLKLWELTKAQKGPGEEGLNPSVHTVLGGPSSESFDGYVVQTKVNRVTTTFAPLSVVYRYAAFISKDFENAVYSAFSELSKGNVQEAASIAESVAVPPELIAKYEKLRVRLNEVVKEKYDSDPKAHSNFNRLAVKAATGYSPSVLHGKKSSSLGYMVEQQHPEAIQATIATMSLMITLITLPYPISYQDVATALQVETSKNKDRLKNLKI